MGLGLRYEGFVLKIVFILMSHSTRHLLLSLANTTLSWLRSQDRRAEMIIEYYKCIAIKLRGSDIISPLLGL